MRVLRNCMWWLLPLAMLGCQGEAPSSAVTQAATSSGDHAGRDWLLPSSPGAAQANLVRTPDGRLLLSWISSVPGRRKALQFDAWGDDGRWQGAPRTIVVGDSLVASWANPPQIAATADGALWVQWLQKAGEGAHLMLSRSADGGFNWSAPMQIDDDIPDAELGFAALWPASRSSIGLLWLESSASGAGVPGTAAHATHAMPAPHDHASGERPTTLHAAIFDDALRRGAGQDVIDTMACDCCRTAVAPTASGALLVYRDRTAAEIRDIAAVRFDGARWSAPIPVHADGWKMTGCPVNGPSVATDGDTAIVAWYTAADDKPAVKLARSRDGGGHFDAPVVLEQGDAVQGRVAVALDAQQVWALWMREDATGRSLWLARYAPDLSRQLQRVQVAKLHSRGNASGYPQLALLDGSAHVVWTDLVDGAPQLRGAIYEAAAAVPATASAPASTPSN
jgi:hypothetical protein